MPNRLVRETSPYLMQHADNPVDWYPWGEEALQRARQEDRPILLSIGYSACHWCHVMAHESFENPEIARVMNDHFVNVKVDREERPDLDEIYMQAVQMMAGHGGWPMTIFLTPDGAPFYGGTYYPPDDRNGLPGFPRVLEAVADAYHNRRAEVTRGSREIVEHLSRQLDLRAQAEKLTTSTLDQAFRGLVGQFDAVEGGFGAAPKFPQPMSLEFALRTFHRTGDPQALWLVERTLEKMARGGIYDHLGGGFHRYAVDARWLVPHFEKMLYDNAQLSLLYLEAYQATGKPLYRQICEQTLDYVRREMTDPAGGFYSSQDADSEGVEGKFYVWEPDEVASVLGPEDADLFCRYYDVTPMGNWERKNIFHVPRDADVVARATGVTVEHLMKVLARGRARLLDARTRRIHPGRDEKILTAWNGLMLRSFAEAAATLDRADYGDVAVRNADFLLAQLREGRRLFRSWKDGRARLDGYLEDYACLADGLLALYEATFDRRWLDGARRLAETAIADFWDQEHGGFFDVGRGHEQLITRPKSFLENAIPAGNSVAVDVLLRLALLLGEPEYARKAIVVLQGLRHAMTQFPTAFGRLLGALDFHLSAPKEIAIVGDPGATATRELLGVIRGRYLPNKVVALRHPDDSAAARAIPLLADRGPLDGRPAAYVCRQYTCGQPVTDPAGLAEQLAAW